MLHISQLTKRYALHHGGVLALDALTIDVAQGEFFTFLGPSGCGKSTALRCVAGLEVPDSGKILIGDRIIFDSTTNLLVAAHRRDYAMVFQSYAIWPHMSVFENVAFPLRVQRLPENEVRTRTQEALELVGLGEAHDRSATLLSGGQQQRVALARAVVRNAKLLLLDEPLSNLDAELRVAMRHELRQLQQRLGVTTIYVTHDQDEALSLSDRIALMRRGRVVELGTPDQLYFRPRNPFTARFIGNADLMPARVVGRNGMTTELDTPVGRILASIDEGVATTSDRMLMLRPEHIEILPRGRSSGDGGARNVLAGRVASVQFSGKITEFEVGVLETTVRVHALSRQHFKAGDLVDLQIPIDRCAVLSTNGANER